MISHRKAVKQLYEFLRNELPEEDRKMMEVHLSGCTTCSGELDALRATTELLANGTQRPSEHRSELYWQHFAEKVDQRIAMEGRDESAPSLIHQVLDAFIVHRKPFGIGFASALTLVMIAFGVWSLWLKSPVSGLTGHEKSPEQSAVKEVTPSALKASIDLKAQDYLEQSKILLIGLMNIDTKALGHGGGMLQREQEVSRRLVSESSVLTSQLTDPSQRRLKELVSDLQLILIQIANLGATHDTPGVEIIKGGIEHNDILFKINLEEIQRMTKPVVRKNQSVKPTT
jgi:hypothetical protein